MMPANVLGARTAVPTLEATSSSDQASEKTSQSNYRVVVSSPIPERWFVDRVHPKIMVELVDAATGEAATFVKDWKIEIQVLTQANSEVQQGVIVRTIAPWVKGRAAIVGLKYLRVSSKAGGSFTLMIQVTPPHPNISIAPFLSEPVQVFSYRLYQAPKYPTHQLRPCDSVSCVRGIGSLYAKRFSTINVRTVSDLAALRIEALTKKEEKDLLSTMRKNRGDMSIARLHTLVALAREIVARSRTGEEQAPCPTPTPTSQIESSPEPTNLLLSSDPPQPATVLSPTPSPHKRKLPRRQDRPDKRICIRNLLC
eukprot:c39425_g1_i1.p1 GENE.c39425_g1_i1~~c39425_g1_i1.p1  ORF type:complete len:326 (+),score=49.46 c39425_g1_i1:47-979(+)